MASSILVSLGADAKITSVTVNGKEKTFKQSGRAISLKVTFAGIPFGQSQQLGKYDPDFTGSVVESTFTIPKRIFAQLQDRKKQWPVPYTDDDRIAPWVDNSRLLLFVQIAEPYIDEEYSVKRGDKDVTLRRRVPYRNDDVTIEIDGEPIEVGEGYNGVYPYVTRTSMGMYVDISNLQPEREYRVKVALPKGLRPGQFQGLFFEHVENEFTKELAN